MQVHRVEHQLRVVRLVMAMGTTDQLEGHLLQRSEVATTAQSPGKVEQRLQQLHQAPVRPSQELLGLVDKMNL